MADGRKENIMTVELAIRRELEYRRKVAMLQLRPDDDPREDLLPLQLKVQSTDSSSIPNPCPDTRANSSLCQSLTGNKPATTSSLHGLPPQPLQYSRHVLKDRSDAQFCKVCQVPCSSPFNYKQHVRGQKHKARVQELNLGRKGGQVGNQRMWCDLCNIWCMNEDAYNQHLEGQKHQKSELAKKNGGEIGMTRKWCELCKIWCIDEASFMLHIIGKKHRLQVDVIARKKRARDEEPERKRLWRSLG